MISTYLAANLTILEARKGYHESMLAIYQEMSHEEIIRFYVELDEVLGRFVSEMTEACPELAKQSLCVGVRQTIKTYDNYLSMFYQMETNSNQLANNVFGALVNLKHDYRRAKRFEENVKLKFSTICKQMYGNARIDKLSIFKDFLLESPHIIEIINNYEKILRSIAPELVELCDDSFNNDEIYKQSGLDPDKDIILFPRQCKKIAQLSKNINKKLQCCVSDRQKKEIEGCLASLKEGQSLATQKRGNDFSNIQNDFCRIKRIIATSEELLVEINASTDNDNTSFLPETLLKSKKNKTPHRSSKSKQKASSTPKLAQKANQTQQSESSCQGEITTLLSAVAEVSISPALKAEAAVPATTATVEVTSQAAAETPKPQNEVTEGEYSYTPYQKARAQAIVKTEMSPELRKNVDKYQEMITRLTSGKVYKVYSFNELMDLVKALGANIERKSGSIRRLSLASPFSAAEAHTDVLEGVANETIHVPHSGNKAKERVGTSFANHFARLLEKAGFVPEKLWPKVNLVEPQNLFSKKNTI